MKNHIAIKFLAVLLCALSLFTSIASVIGIAVLEREDIYAQDVPAIIEETKLRVLSGAAKAVAGQYLSEVMGGCSPTLVEEYYSTYGIHTELVRDTWGYELRSPEGQILAADYPENMDEMMSHDFQTLTHYVMLVEPPVPADPSYNDFYGNHDPMFTPTVAPSVNTTHPTEPNELPDALGGTYGIIYWDEEENCYMEANIRDVGVSGYSVTMYYSDGSFATADTWELVQVIWSNRYALFWALGISLLIFAICAVYLCCAAGRKPGSDEIKAGGFNALPLDLYLLIIAFLLFLDYEIAQELLSWFDLSYAGIVFVGVCAGFIPSLLFVAYCFAWAAQITEGNGRWWRGSAIGWCCRVAWWLSKSFVTVFCPWVGRTAWKSLKTIFRFAKIILTVIWETFRNAVKWVWVKVTGAFWWVGRKVERVYSLLPVTWQWMLTGMAMVALLLMGLVHALRRYDPLGLLVCIGVCLALVLYGAHAFGILLEGAKKMSRGDLDTPVSDRLLVGAFREFAESLNSLGGAAKLAAQKEMKSERMKTELITNVSHDIKTPLTSIINYVDLLQKPHTPEEEAQYLEVLGRKSQQLKKLIQDLTEMSKASTGNMAVEIRRVSATEAVTQALGEFSDKLEGNRITPVVTSPAEDMWMMADGRLAWRVLQNLLSNAVKYAMAGTRLYVDISRQGNQVRISLKNVSALSLNISAEELMERFVRGDAARNTEGSGLGLNIARSLMEVQGGTLELAIDGDLFKATLSFPAA